MSSSSKSQGAKSALYSVEEYEKAALGRLNKRLVNYIFRGTESESTLRRNIEAFSKYALRRRVLQSIDSVDLSTSYFGGRIKSELPFFPSCINVSPMYKGALEDLLSISKNFKTPIFVSHLAIEPLYEISKLPKLVPETSPLVWQIYFRKGNTDLCIKQAGQAESWGYKGLAITVDAELNVRLGYGIPNDLSSTEFSKITDDMVKRVRKATNLPLVIKGIMTAEDAARAVELGADGIVISNHGGRILDEGEGTLDALPEITTYLKSKSRTIGTEIFFDGGIRKGTDVLKALALGARGCLIGRPLFWALAVDRKNGASKVMKILRDELERAAYLCGVSSVSKLPPAILKKRERSI